MFATERQRRILEHLRAHGSASVHELAEVVDCSDVTIRRDLLQLGERGLVDRRRGGATFPHVEPTSLVRPQGDDGQPSALADLAADLVNDGETIVLGSGTTIATFAARLVGKVDLTVVTNSLLVGDALAGSSVHVVMTGGSLRGSTMSLVGSGAERIFAELKVRRAFLSGDGLTSTWGLSAADAELAGVERAIAAASEEVVVIAESAAVGIDAMSLTVPCERIGDVVTDDQADPEVLDGLRANGVRVHTAPALRAGVR